MLQQRGSPYQSGEHHHITYSGVSSSGPPPKIVSGQMRIRSRHLQHRNTAQPHVMPPSNVRRYSARPTVITSAEGSPASFKAAAGTAGLVENDVEICFAATTSQPAKG
ncbi:hypothetical protein ACHWUR_28565 [Klebsiella pneumoniae]